MQDITSAATPPLITEIPLEKCSIESQNYANGPYKLQRDEHGLLKNVEYKFTEIGYVSWREMVDPKFLYPNKDWFEARGETVPESIEGLEDAQLLIQLGGIKELARLRGFNSVSFSLTHPSNSCVSSQCTINWIPNYENPNGCIFESTANATFDNTSGFGAKFLETIAENRAFVRAVRNFLNIHIAGADEIDKSKNKVLEVDNAQSTTPTAQSTLEKQVNNAGLKTYEEFREKFLNPKIKDKTYSPAKKPENPWLGYADIPAEECRRIISLIKKNK